MRPARFAAFLQQLIRDDPQQTGAWPLAECGYTACPYGVVLGLPTRALVYLQCVASSPPGQRPDEEELVVHGAPPPPIRAPDLAVAGLTPMVNVERYLGALITGAQHLEVAEVKLYADREKQGAVPHGLNVRFHSGARIYLYVRHQVASGRQLAPHDKPFRPVSSV